MNRWKKESDAQSRKSRWHNAQLTDGVASREEKAMSLFAEMMIEKIKSVSQDWKKPWIYKSVGVPRNMDGRMYNGMNSLMLSMLCEKAGYKIPRFATFNHLKSLNDTEKNPENHVQIKKGAKSFPVYATTFSVVDRESKERIPYDDYQNLPEEEKRDYAVYPRTKVYNVFNVEQTNLQEVRPELWAKFVAEYEQPQREDHGNDFSFAPIDAMIEENRWICPIKPTHGNRAYFSQTQNEIVVPEKSQFVDGESFYGSLLHEMTHSTGHESVLDRLKPCKFGSPDYAREELVAELGSALVAQRYGMEKYIGEDSAPYLKSWLGSLNESPEYIKTVLYDVKRATAVITQQVDKIALEQKTHQTEEISQSPSVEKEAAQQELNKAMEDEKEEVSGVDINGDGEIAANEMHTEHHRSFHR